MRALKYLAATFVLTGVLVLSGCAGGAPFVDEGITPANSVACLDGMYSGTWANGNLRGTRLRFPDEYDVSELDPETIGALAEVLCK